MVSMSGVRNAAQPFETVKFQPPVASPHLQPSGAVQNAGVLKKEPIPTGEFYDTATLEKVSGELGKLTVDKTNAKFLDVVNGQAKIGDQTYDVPKLLRSYLRPGLLTMDPKNKASALESMSHVIAGNDFHIPMRSIAQDGMYKGNLKQAMDDAPELKTKLYEKAFFENADEMQLRYAPHERSFKVLPNTYLSALDGLYDGNGLGAIGAELVRADQKTPAELERLLPELQNLSLEQVNLMTSSIFTDRPGMEKMVKGLEQLDPAKKNEFYKALLPLGEDGTVKPGLFAQFFDSFGSTLLSVMFHLEIDPGKITSLGSYYQNAPWVAGSAYEAAVSGFDGNKEGLYFSPEYALEQLDQIMDTDVGETILNVVQTNPLDMVTGRDINQLTDALEAAEGDKKYYLGQALSGLQDNTLRQAAAGVNELNEEDSKRFFRAASGSLNLEDLQAYYKEMQAAPVSASAILDNPKSLFTKHGYADGYGWVWGANSVLNRDKVNHGQILKDAVSDRIANPTTERDKKLNESVEAEGGIDQAFS